MPEIQHSTTFILSELHKKSLTGSTPLQYTVHPEKNPHSTVRMRV